MSGLVGWVDLDRDLRAAADVVHAMTDTMSERGPDGKGVHLGREAALGVRRLAVPGAGGEQPAEAGDVVLGYDGALDNLPELRREVAAAGVLTGAGSDTEVLLGAYLLWGERFVERVWGAFAIAIWDARHRRLLLCRDRLGLRPLYYADYPGGILFASLPRGIMANPLFRPRLEPAALPILLQPRLTLPGETPLAGLREVPPGHVVRFGSGGVVVSPFWRLTTEPHRESFAATAGHVRELLADAVRRQLPESGECSAMLSGGVDSTSVAALAAAQLRAGDPSRALDTYCLRFDGDDVDFAPTELRPETDAPYAAAAAEYLGSRHRTLVATGRDLDDVVPATRRARDLPGWGQFDASMYLLFHRMRGAGPVALSGEAADEFFGGYPYLFKSELVARGHFPWLGDGPKLSDYLAPRLARQLDPPAQERERYRSLLAQVPRLPGEDPADARMREVLYLGMGGPLQVILDRKERMSAAQGLQVRLPFCDHRLVQYVWNVPWSMKATGGLKGLLKAAMADLLPPGTLNRSKSAYPHAQNPAQEQALLRAVSAAVNDRDSPVRELFDVPRLNDLLDRIGSGGPVAMLPGGASPAQLLVQIAELRHWITDYQVALP